MEYIFSFISPSGVIIYHKANNVATRERPGEKGLIQGGLFAGIINAAPSVTKAAENLCAAQQNLSRAVKDRVKPLYKI
jgi:hypothetical protein